MQTSAPAFRPCTDLDDAFFSRVCELVDVHRDTGKPVQTLAHLARTMRHTLVHEFSGVAVVEYLADILLYSLLRGQLDLELFDGSAHLTVRTKRSPPAPQPPQQPPHPQQLDLFNDSKPEVSPHGKFQSQ
jgi:hypothetical protein